MDKLKVSDIGASTSIGDLSSFCLNSSSTSFYFWHSRLRHVSTSRLKYLTSTRALGKLKTSDISNCCGCKLAKFSAFPFNKSVYVSNTPFDLIPSDVWDPSLILTNGGSRYYVSFIDDYTRYYWVYIMKNHSKLFYIYRIFWAMIKTQHNVVIKCFCCNLGGEYTSNKLYELLTSDGNIHKSSCTDNPQQNGVVERKNHHIVETARSLLLSVSVPSAFWGKAICVVVRVINKVPSSVTSDLSSFETLYGNTPEYSYLKVFGSTCFVLLPQVECSKLSPRSTTCVFLGYGDGQKGYHCYDPTKYKMYVYRHVVFLEHILFYSFYYNSHTHIRSEFIHIDPFSFDDDISSDYNVEN